MKTKKVFGCGGVVHYEIIQIINGKKRKFGIKKEGKHNPIIAYFDTEEKARLYSDGVQKGINWGYSAGYKKFSK